MKEEGAGIYELKKTMGDNVYFWTVGRCRETRIAGGQHDVLPWWPLRMSLGMGRAASCPGGGRWLLT